jgi:sec-independent protein translocase protein TatC
MAQAATTTELSTVKPESEGPGGRMPFMLHLRELRDRVFRSVIAVVLGIVVGVVFGNQLIVLLERPAPKGIHLIAVELLENFSVFFKVSLTAGIILAMPYLVYQLFAFVAPGLTSKEKRLIFTLLPGIVFMFLSGVAFAYFVALPPALNFLFHFGADLATVEVRISNYIDVVTRMLLVVGLVFETPLIVMLLARMGIVSPKWLAARRKWWVVIAFTLGAIITPTFDPVNQTIISVPLILLLELGILLARLVYKKKREVPAKA